MFPPWLLQPHRPQREDLFWTALAPIYWLSRGGWAGTHTPAPSLWAGEAAAAPAAVIEPIRAQHLSPAEKAAVTAAHGSQHLTPPASGFPTLHSHAEGFCRANGDDTCAALLPRSLGDTTKGTLLAVRASLPPPAGARNVYEEKHYPSCLQSTFTLRFGI